MADTPNLAETVRRAFRSGLDSVWVVREGIEALAELERRAARADTLQEALRDVRGFVRTGGPLYNKDRLELLVIIDEALAAVAPKAEE